MPASSFFFFLKNMYRFDSKTSLPTDTLIDFSLILIALVVLHIHL